MESSRTISIRRHEGGEAAERDDCLAVEEPMEIRVAFGPESAREAKSLSITMRTPGEDFELAAGFLFTEQILRDREQIRQIEFCGPPAPGRSTSNIVRVDLAPGVELDRVKLERHFYATSSCGICGKASLDALEIAAPPKIEASSPRIDPSVIHTVPDVLRAAQPLFDKTGGLHAAALVDAVDGRILEPTIGDLREDVGRHNAVDKLLGRRFLDGRMPLSQSLLVLSGRASFEIGQKALAAGIPAIVAVGAPSTLAVDLAERHGVTLIGFASDRRFNVYAGAQRVAG